MNGCRQNDKKHHHNQQVLHLTVHLLKPRGVKSCVFVRIVIFKAFLTSYCLFLSRIVDFDVRVQQRKDFFNGRSVIVDYGLIFWPEAAV